MEACVHGTWYAMVVLEWVVASLAVMAQNGSLWVYCFINKWHID